MSTEKVKRSEKISERIKRMRTEKGWGQVRLAQLMDVSSGAIGNWETGSRPPTAENVRKLADLFGVTTRWLLYGDETLLSGAGNTTADKCRDHFEKFLATCDDESKLGWLLWELNEHFPLNKFRGEIPPDDLLISPGPLYPKTETSLAILNETEKRKEGLTEAQQIALAAGKKYDEGTNLDQSSKKTPSKKVIMPGFDEAVKEHFSKNLPPPGEGLPSPHRKAPTVPDPDEPPPHPKGHS